MAEPEAVVLRFGLHWGATLVVGQILTSGRSEVTALGDEVNEGARIEACATGGRALASEDLLERLAPEDAAALGREGLPGRTRDRGMRGVGTPAATLELVRSVLVGPWAAGILGGLLDLL